MTLLTPLLQLEPINLLTLYQNGTLQEEYPDLAKMKLCPQNPKWHAEGDVLIHTQMVLEEGFRLLDQLKTYEEKVALLLGCLLHDVGKPIVTDKQTLSASGHEGVGLAIAGQILHDLGVSLPVKGMVLEMVRDHGVPKQLQSAQSKDSSYRKLALRSSCKMLYYVELADFRGREGEKKQESLEALEAFREKTQQLGLFGVEVPLELQHFEQLLQNVEMTPLKRRWIVHQHLKKWISGHLPENIHQPSLQKLLNQVEAPPWLLYTMGISGSGKSTWAKKHQEGFFYISTDQTREEMNGSAEIQEKDKDVFTRCYERLSATLRAKQSVLWDATNVTHKAREMLLTQSRFWSPCVGLLYFPTLFEESLKQNQMRSRQVPESVLRRQVGQFYFPKFHEYEHYWQITKENAHEPLVFPEF